MASSTGVRSLAALARRGRPQVLAGDELLPVMAGLGELLGWSGLKRGATLAVHGGRSGDGATSLALALLAAASAAGSWSAAVGLPALGPLAAGELGVDLARLVLVPDPGARFVAVVAALLDGCDLVLARPPGPLARSEARRLSARARERRCVLVVATGTVGALRGGPVIACSAAWPEPVDVHLEVRHGTWQGLGEGSGRLHTRVVDVVATRRRAAPERVEAPLELPAGTPPPAGEGAPAPPVGVRDARRAAQQ